MAFKRLEFEKDWKNPEDFPTHESSEAQVRADMQYHPDAVKDFINALLSALESRSAAAALGAAGGDDNAATVQSILDAHAQSIQKIGEDLETLAAGGVPVSMQSAAVAFSVASWLTVADGVALTISKEEHGRSRETFGFSLYQLVDNIYRSGTWGTACTRVTYNPDGSITLTADAAYAGKIVFFGL